jgi:hypothetical protein
VKTIRRHLNAIRYAYRVAVMTYRRELMHDTIPF